MATTYHIRRPRRPARGNQFYRDRSHRSQGTYCGAVETQYDVSHGTRVDTDKAVSSDAFAGFKPCQACVDLRAAEKC